MCHGSDESVTYCPPTRTRRSPPSSPTPNSSPRRRHRSWQGRASAWCGWAAGNVPGIEAGTEVRLKGMLTQSEGLPTIFNPRYEILSRQENE